jgi:arsenate reductase (thioredoxin)
MRSLSEKLSRKCHYGENRSRLCRWNHQWTIKRNRTFVRLYIFKKHQLLLIMKILILCTGNSCRSQMAHGYLQHLDAKLTVCSAGTAPAGQVNPKAVEVMKQIGIDISHHTSDSVDMYLEEEWDYVITVCGGAKEVCPAFIGKVKHRLHIGFDDPYEARGTDEFVMSEYRRIRDEIVQGFRELYFAKLSSGSITH